MGLINLRSLQILLRIIIALVIVFSLGLMHLSYALDYTIPAKNTHDKPIIATPDNMPAIDSDSIIRDFQTEANNVLKTKPSNPELVVLDNQSGKAVYGLPSYWGNLFKSCDDNFNCIANSTNGWRGSTSLQVSTNTTTKHTLSSISGSGIEVIPRQTYQLTTHMKLNQYATQSHVSLEAYNQTSKKWHQVLQCPIGTNGPLEWKQFSCQITIPANTMKIRPVLYSGWSSQSGKQAVTWYGPLYITNLGFAPTINDPNLKAELVYKGLEGPTTMAFLGPNDFLVLEKNTGNVYRITNGTELKNPLLKVAVFHNDGLKGIAISKNTTHIPPTTYVFLYFTESAGGTNGEDVNASTKAKCNCLYRYELLDNKLVNPKLLLQLPVGVGPVMHNGGVVKIGPDNNVYVIMGTINGTISGAYNKVLNFADGAEPDGRAGILRVTQDGKPAGNGIIGDKYPLNLYYAYGIRNSFGIDFDPISGKLWETENGPAFGDEINLVEPGFNSGWGRMMGIWQVNAPHEGTNFKNTTIPNNLVTFGGKGKYRSPEFTWNNTVGPTAITFLNSGKLGKQYQNDMFVADINNGNIYHFKLNQNRTDLLLNGSLADKVAHSPEDLQGIIFATGFGPITDLEVGPDGYLYVVGIDQGKVYRILPAGVG